MSMLPFDDRDGLIWFDGALVDWRDAKLHVLTHGLHYASCVFEGERVYNGRIFKLTEHSQRLADSAKILGFELGMTVDEIDAASRRVVEAMGITDGYVRPVAWRGSRMMGVSAQQAGVHVAIAAWEWPSYFSPEARMAGIKLQTSQWRRPAPDTAPVRSKAAGLYMICTMSKHATVIGLAKARGYEVVERPIMPHELADAAEIFLTGTAAEVTPVGQIDDLTYKPGIVCQTLMEDYDRLVRSPAADDRGAAGLALAG